MRSQILFVTSILMLVGSQAACGDDSGDAGNGVDAGPTGNGDGDAPAGDGDAPGDGDGPVGDGEEGTFCTATGDCGADLSCVASGVYADMGVCARACASAEECGAERCLSTSGDEADLYCANGIRDEFAECGVADTSFCATQGQVCLHFGETGLGVCVTPCNVVVERDDDGGVSLGMSQDCGAGRNCFPIDTQRAVCGTEVGRGAPCGLDVGGFCELGETCAPDDVDDLDGTWSCRQDCTVQGTACDEGTTCVDVRGEFAFCQ